MTVEVRLLFLREILLLLRITLLGSAIFINDSQYQSKNRYF